MTWPCKPPRLILDFDATDTPLHGDQEGRFFHGYYDHYCYLPLYVFCGRHLLVSYLRRSNSDPARHTGAILSLLVKALRRQWPKVEIVLRGDSGFCRWQILRWCERHDVHYIVGLAKNVRVKAQAALWISRAESLYDRTGKKQRLFASVRYGALSWDKPRRVIVKAEHSRLGANPRFVVTNLPQTDQYLYDKLYCARGDRPKTGSRTSSSTCLQGAPPVIAGGPISSGNCCRAWPTRCLQDCGAEP